MKRLKAKLTQYSIKELEETIVSLSNSAHPDKPALSIVLEYAIELVELEILERVHESDVVRKIAVL